MSKKHKKTRTDMGTVEYAIVRPLVRYLPKGDQKPTQVLEATIVNICRAYNITYDDIQQFLSKRGFPGIPKDGKVTESYVLNQLDFDFRTQKAEWDSIQSTRMLIGIKAVKRTDTKDNRTDTKDLGKKVLSIDTGDYRMKLENVHRLKQYDVSGQDFKPKHTVNSFVPNHGAIPNSKISNNIFVGVRKTIKFGGNAPFVSYFSDEQAANICSKMTDSYPRALADKIGNNKGNELIFYQLHHIANKALQIFGGEVLSFLLSLRRLEFKNFQALELKTYYKVIPDFPIITLKSSSKVFKVAFFATKRHNGDLYRDVRIFDKENVEIGFIDEFGRIEAKLERFKPHLGIFYEVTKAGNYELYSGVESGLCEVCQRKLSHPLSIRVGIGPVCAENLRLDRALYNFSI
jgi:hypothetical protein